MLFEGYISPAVRRGVHVLFQTYFHPKDSLQQEVDDFVSQHFTGKIVIGVHIRAADHGVETLGSKIPGPLDWVKSVHTLIFKLGVGPVNQLTAKDVTIFVASDNLPALDVFEKAFQKRFATLKSGERKSTGGLSSTKGLSQDTPPMPHTELEC